MSPFGVYLRGNIIYSYPLFTNILTAKTYRLIDYFINKTIIAIKHITYYIYCISLSLCFPDEIDT